MFQSIDAVHKALASRAKKIAIAKALRVDAKFIDSVAREAAELLYKHEPNPLISARVLSAIMRRELDARDNALRAPAALPVPIKNTTVLGNSAKRDAAA